jgi:hypothetical protein
LRSQPSKGDSGYSKAILGAIIIYAAFRYLPFLAAVLPAAASLPAAAQAVIPSRIIKVVEFEDRGRSYRVDLESGRVTFTGGEIQPTPEPSPKPEPPKPEPPKPTPTPELKGFASKIHTLYRSKVTTNIPETAEALAQAIEVTVAVTGGLGLKGQQILDELSRQIDHAKLHAKLAGFPFGDALKEAIGDDPDKIVPALREAMIGLRAVR